MRTHQQDPDELGGHRLTCALLLVGLTAGGGLAMALEQPDYEVLERQGAFELRRYEPHIVAETYVDADFESAGNAGFRRLADFIFGNNRSRRRLPAAGSSAGGGSEKIAMTAPVNMHKEGDLYRITFMMPSSYTMETLPEPINPQVRIREIPARLMAALRYSGTWSRLRYEDHQTELEAWIAARGWQPADEPILARYDPPFKPWFLRRNEVLIPIADEASR